MNQFDHQQMSMMSATQDPHKLDYQENYEDNEFPHDNRPYGDIRPLTTQFLGMQLYSNPQCGMLIFTIILTLTLETVMLKYVFFGMHFYIGCGLCLLILYLLLSLGYSNPGFGFEEYDNMQYHFDVEGCTQSCKHRGDIKQLFKYYCQKCSTPVKQRTKHCNICNTCVSEYDHHCVFIGKCVGGNNFGRFKLFLFMIFSTLIYGLVSALMSLQQIKQIKS